MGPGARRSGQTLAERTEAVLLTCRLEVTMDPVTPLEAVDDNHFRMVFQPALDSTDRRQFRGCVQDWTIDHVLVNIEAMNEL